ncbi:uncharacterized protein LOC123309617 [Coccinella septempunctata]|uniref:uncharacterized protein LOC123309617 n=1 Tax=Coccinella septempunctata TaxID=41139 RepID=UPI001D08EDAE|nr:uncharacterized protein LOC123309617 [Coccinella septempunctata]
MTLSKPKMLFRYLFYIVSLYELEFRVAVAVPVLPLSNKEDKRECCADRMNAISSNIAIKAAEEAKAAQYAQIPAACQAAHQVKEQLAEKAIEAAKAAQAALVGKVALVEELSREQEAVKIVLQEEVNSKLQLEHAINEGMKALAAVKTLLNVITSGLKLAETTAQNADCAVRGVDRDLQEKNILLQQALRAVEILTREEAMARNDLDTTKCAVRRAMQAAAAAKANAMRNKRQSSENTPHVVKNA